MIHDAKEMLTKVSEIAIAQAQAQSSSSTVSILFSHLLVLFPQNLMLSYLTEISSSINLFLVFNSLHQISQIYKNSNLYYLVRLRLEDLFNRL